MAAPITNGTELEAALRGLMTPSGTVIRVAEVAIKDFTLHAQCVAGFLEQIRSNAAPEIRQMAAVLLRKVISSHWSKLSLEEQTSVKNVLLECILRDPQHLVRLSVANLVSAVAKYTVPKNEWNELLVFLLQCSQSAEDGHREVSMVLFRSLTETVGKYMRPHFATLQQIFKRGLEDPRSHPVRLASLKAVGALVSCIESDEELAIFSALIEPTLNVIRACITSGDDDMALRAFEIFDELIFLDLPSVMACIPPLLVFMSEIAINRSLAKVIRDRSLTFLQWVCEYKPKVFTKTKQLPSILSVIFALLAEPQDPDEDEDIRLPIFKVAAELLDYLVRFIPYKHLFTPVVTFASTSISSTNWLERRGAMVALLITCEGLQDPFRENLSSLLPIIYQGISDSEPKVRETSYLALGHFSEFLQPDILQHHDKVLPLVFHAFGDSSESVKEQSCFLLQAFCENLGSEIMPYLTPLMTKLLELLQSGTRKMQETVLSAISSAAVAAGSEFLPYFSTICMALHAAMQLTEDTDLVLRARATECAGHICIAVGREACSGVLPTFASLAMQGFAIDYAGLREYTFGFFASIAHVLGRDFAPFMAPVVSESLKSIESADGAFDPNDDGEDADDEGDDGEDDEDDADEGPSAGGRKKSASGFLSGSDSDDDSDEEPYQPQSVRTDFMDEKSAALHCVEEMALATGDLFFDYVEVLLPGLELCSQYLHEDVRINAIQALCKVALSVAAHLGPSAIAGGSASDAFTHMSSIIDSIITMLCGIVESDDDRETVAHACAAIGETTRKCGPPFMEKHLKVIRPLFLKIVRGKAVCQRYSDDEEDEGGIDADEHLLDAMGDTLSWMAEGFGPSFLPFFEALLPDLLKYMKPTRSAFDRVTVLGIFGEMYRHMQWAMQPHTEKLIPLVLRSIADSDQAMKRNASFCAGVICLYGGATALPHFGTLFTALRSVITTPGTQEAAVDNAVGAMARMVMANPSVMPLQDVLPIMLSGMPIRTDFIENETIFQCILTLLMTSPEAVMAQIPTLIKIFAHVLGTSQLSAPLQEQVVSFLRTLRVRMPAELSAVVAALSEAERAKILAAAP